MEYDLFNSGEDDLKLLNVDRIEQSAVPTAATWYPPLTKESFLLITNDQVLPSLYCRGIFLLNIHYLFNSVQNEAL